MSEISECYARALMDLAIEENSIKAYLEDAKTLVGLLDEDVLHFLSLSIIDKHIKKEQLRTWFKDFNPNIINLCCLVVDKNRALYLKEIFMDYIHEAFAYLNIKEVCIISAKPLKEEIIKRIKNAIGAKYDCDVEITLKLDDSLISGFKVLYDAKVIDMTMKKKIASMRQDLLESW